MSTPTTPKTPTPPTLPAGITKICHIVKRADFDGYGFNLHSEKVKPGQFIGKVDAGSPAEAAGLKEGDRILEVNGVSIGSETHKQVVARIKAISNEVRLLLIDVDGKGDAPVNTTNGNGNATTSTTPTPPATTPTTPTKATTPTTPTVATTTTVTEHSIERSSSSTGSSTKQEIPGSSANISSISMVSTKRSSTTSSTRSGSTTSATDVVDKATTVAPSVATQNGLNNAMHELSLNKPTTPPPPAFNNNNNLMSTAPPPPSAQVATINNNNNNNTNGNGNGNVYGNGSNGNTTTTVGNSGTGINRAGSLNLPLTAAEMRAKLASKKKYDPKNESVDLKKKFEIIQKL